MSSRSTPHHVVIVGSGFGGLFAARALRGAPVSVTVIARTNHHLFQPLLYQVATGILSEGEIAPAIRDVLRRHRHTTVLLAEVVDLDLDRKLVQSVQDGRHLETPYDSLIVATGVETSYFGHEEFGEWAPSMKTIDDALELRGRLFGAFELAEAEPDPARREALLTFIVVGGGPTGVEVAGQIVELAHRALRSNYRHIDPSHAKVMLFEGGPEIMPAFGKRITSITNRSLTKLGVKIATDALVVGMDADSVTVRHGDGRLERVPAGTKVWAAGMRANPLGAVLAEQTGAEQDKIGRVKVRSDCTLPGHPELFVVGDLMTFEGVPGMAEGAIQSGIHAASTIKRRLGGEETERPFRYRDLGMLATISRFRAVSQIGKLQFGGFVGWLLWLVVHLTFLTGFKNRFAALTHWAISFVGRGRSERTITDQQVIARQAIARASREAPEPLTTSVRADRA